MYLIWLVHLRVIVFRLIISKYFNRFFHQLVNEVAEMKMVVYYLKEAITEFKRALAHTPGSFQSQWGAGILERIAECFDVGLARIGMFCRALVLNIFEYTNWLILLL